MIGSSATSLVLVSSCRVGVQRQEVVVMRRGSSIKLNQVSPCIGILPPPLLASSASSKTDLEISLLGGKELLGQSLGVPLIS